jgi:hypothetical protein
LPEAPVKFLFAPLLLLGTGLQGGFTKHFELLAAFHDAPARRS